MTTQEWLDILEGSGMPYAPINDVQTTLQTEHSMCTPGGSPRLLLLTCNSLSTEHDYRSRAFFLWAYEACQPASQVFGVQAKYTQRPAHVRPTYGRDIERCP